MFAAPLEPLALDPPSVERLSGGPGAVSLGAGAMPSGGPPEAGHWTALRRVMGLSVERDGAEPSTSVAPFERAPLVRSASVSRLSGGRPGVR